MAASADAPEMATFVFSLLDKGTKKYDANELAAARDKIGMSGGARAGLERSSFGFRILNTHLAAAMGLAAEILRNPIFPDEELVKVKAQIAAYLANLELAPARAASGLFDRAIYGAENQMGSVWTPQLLEQVDRAGLQAFHRAEVTPDIMTVYMIGNIGIDEAREAVNAAFGKWRATSDSALKPVGNAVADKARVILIDYPGAESSTIYAGHAIGPYDAKSWSELSIMNRAFGGGFESRLNMNLREDKSWSYGYRSGVSRNWSGDMALISSGQVQTDKTMESMVEIKREFEDFVSTRPATTNEIDRIKLNRTRSIPGTFATNGGFLSSIISSDSYNLPYDYAETAAARIQSVTVDGVNERARSIIEPDKLTWVVVGDLEQIEEKVRTLDYGDIEVWDAFGNKLR
jgi:zinc protease